MHEDYCFKCGSYVPIDEATKLCGPCYDGWPYKTSRGTGAAQ